MDHDQLRSIVSGATVGVAGAGGLGSNCAASLLRAGVRRLVIADFDTVTRTNLDRQYYFLSQVGRFKVEALKETLLAIDPEAQIDIHVLRVDPIIAERIFAGCDVIVEAFDDAEEKVMLIETCLRAFPETHIVAASGLAGVGNFEAIRVIHRGRLHICGDFESETSPLSPPVAPRVGIVANLQADTALQLILDKAEGRL
jgi:sulfur carrier protein ThiS adenylyltransferase